MVDDAPDAVVAGTMAVEAAAFLAALDADQLAVGHWDFPADTERRRWYYTPTDHGGLALAAMSPGQQQRALRLVASGLSEAGFATAVTIIGLETILDRVEGYRTDFRRVRGRDPGLYYVTVFGRPGDTEPWGWRFGGHHLSVHHTIVDGRLVASTPSFFGANPATTELLGPHFLRPLAGLQDTALDLMASLDPQQRARAVVSPVPPTDIVTANLPSIDVGTDRVEPIPLAEIWREAIEGELRQAYDQRQRRMEGALGLTADHRQALAFTSTPLGLPAAELGRAQRHGLTDLLGQYLHRLPDQVADREMAAIAGERFDGLHLAWAGSTVAGEPMYYRIQGDGLVVEFDNTQGGANHIHAVWRDPQGDFGLDVLADHYATSHRAPSDDAR